jgi:GH24 family phage-related lysozyme (muramidase)
MERLNAKNLDRAQDAGHDRDEQAGGAQHNAQAGYLQRLRGEQSYEVQPGDTLSTIAERFLGDGKRWRDLAKLNGIRPQQLQTGSRIRIPQAEARRPPKPATTAQAAPTGASREPPPPRDSAADRVIAGAETGQSGGGGYAAFIAGWEGFEPKAYWDNIQWSIGYGTRVDAAVTNKYGVDRHSTVDEALAMRMLTDGAAASVGVAREFATDFESLPDGVKQIVVDLAYNLGSRGIYKFKNFRTALNAREYGKAADELQDSSWYGQVGRRSAHHVGVLRGL